MTRETATARDGQCEWTGSSCPGGQTDPRPPIGRTIPVPAVYAWTPSTDPMDTSVVPDHEAGANAAVRHLLGTGRRRVGHMTGPQQFRAVELRAAGAIRALQEEGLELAPPGVLCGDWSEAWGRQAAAILARSCPELGGYGSPRSRPHGRSALARSH